MSAINPSSPHALRLLGGFALECDGQPTDLAYAKGRALLAYLAAEPGRTHARASLAAMFWPDLGRPAALANLRLVLHDLRQALNPAQQPAPLQVAREFIRLTQLATLEIDVAEFSAPAPVCPATPCPAHCEPCMAQMQTLAERFRGEFMAGFSLPECTNFEAWMHSQREALHLRALVLLARLADCHERFGNYAKSLPFALRFLALEPWNEEGLRRAMRLLAFNGQRSTALATYESCCATLKAELGVLPGVETRVLAEHIRRSELPPKGRRATDRTPLAVLPLPVAHRRQVTVLYCELSSPEVEDPDQALALLREPQALCQDIIRRHSGHLVQTHGGSLLAYFGYPQARENAARLAVQAALAVTRTRFSGLELRVGIHTGLVISGDDPQLPDALGATSALAIGLRQLAEPGTVLLSAATQHLVTGYFECPSLGLQRLPGSARPLEVFRAKREHAGSSRLEAAARLTPLIGRQDEIATLLDLWQDARRTRQRCVLLQGEAGIGKSRLVLALKDALRTQAPLLRELRCAPEHSQSPFYPLAALFGLTLAFAPEDSPQARFDTLAAYVEAHYQTQDPEAVPLLAGMLALPLRAPYQAPLSSAQQQRTKGMQIVLDRLNALAQQQPLLLVVEDLHWADPSTLAFLNLFVAQARPRPILAVFTARPGFDPPWAENQVRRLSLTALDDVRTAALIGAVAPALAPLSVRRIVERADGVPLFAEELAREASANDQSAIPRSLQDLLVARLDAMGVANVAAQAAASIGREFSFDLLRRVLAFDAASLAPLLARLQDAGLLAGGARGDFHFRHSLMRDAAYQSQTRAAREAVHQRIAAELTAEGASAARPELLAQHWAAAGATGEAIACWIAAGRLAHQHSASQEAATHFKSGLTLIGALPTGAQQQKFELELQIGLGAAALAAQGYASADSAAAYARAMVLCSRQSSDPELFATLWGLWASASSRSGYATAQELAQQLLRLAGQSGDPVQQQQAHFAVADTLYWQGEFPAALVHLERVRALYRPAQHGAHVAGFGEDAGVTSGAYASWVLWFLGLPDQACQTSAQTLTLARRLGHPFSLAYALTFAAILRCRLRQPEPALVLAQEALDLATQHGFPLWQIGATLVRGWARAMQGQPEGMETLEQCVQATRAAMGGVTLVVLEPLVDANVTLGRFDAALGVHDEAFALGNTLGDHHVEAELHRLKGEALCGLTGANAAQAEVHFDKALSISRRQQAKSLELRAAMSLARLWQSQGKPGGAQHLLQAAYDGFTEGFDTPDLQDARTLLDSLAR